MNHMASQDQFDHGTLQGAEEPCLIIKHYRMYHASLLRDHIQVHRLNVHMPHRPHLLFWLLEATELWGGIGMSLPWIPEPCNFKKWKAQQLQKLGNPHRALLGPSLQLQEGGGQPSGPRHYAYYSPRASLIPIPGCKSEER